MSHYLFLILEVFERQENSKIKTIKLIKLEIKINFPENNRRDKQTNYITVDFVNINCVTTSINISKFFTFL